MSEKMSEQWYCRVAPSLGALEGDPNTIWGTIPYEYSKHKHENLIQFGAYDLRDYLAIWKHKGRTAILWAGSDLRNLAAGFVFNDGKLRYLSMFFRSNRWIYLILLTAEHYVENEWEKDILLEHGIESKVVPSYMGKTPAISYTPKKIPHIYLSSGTGRQEEYGWDTVERIAPKVNGYFHLYGATWHTKRKNVITHGRVPKEVMNHEIKDMQCGLRLNKTDGFSEITAKSVLMGQYPITFLEYPLIPSAQNDEELISLLNSLPEMKKPNTKARSYYKKTINRYPWNTNV